MAEKRPWLAESVPDGAPIEWCAECKVLARYDALSLSPNSETAS